jgi:hypothetical protein
MGIKIELLGQISYFASSHPSSLRIVPDVNTLCSQVQIDPLPGKKVEHMGIKIELLGQIELYFDRGNFYDFTSLVRELDVPGEIKDRKTFAFEFSNVEMQYESYNGVNVRLRYILKVTISRSYAANIVKEKDFWVRGHRTTIRSAIFQIPRKIDDDLLYRSYAANIVKDFWVREHRTTIRSAFRGMHLLERRLNRANIVEAKDFWVGKDQAASGLERIRNDDPYSLSVRDLMRERSEKGVVGDDHSRFRDALESFLFQVSEPLLFRG